jgi:histidinol-phosphatase (PHP family)
MPADYHTHTPLCRHAQGEPEAYVAAALLAGVTEYGVSDHAPMQPEPYDDWRMLDGEMTDYWRWIERARTQAAGALEVRAGLECDWLPGCEPWIEQLAARHSWDYLIGSVHYLLDETMTGWDFDNPKWLGRWPTLDLESLWTNYWLAYAAMAESGLFDILGHPDLVKKFGYFPAGDLARFYAPVIDAVAAAGCVIELNTAGWHKPCVECYPAPGFLELACSAGIPLVISSDAHEPGHVGRDFAKAIALARSAGYKETVLFKQRQRRTEALPLV